MSGTKPAPPPLLKTLDDRTGIAAIIKGYARKIFPDHWSFLLGEIALYSFVVLLISGIFLTMFYVPSMDTTVYHGSFAPMRGVEMSQAYASTLNLSFEIRGGLLMRQIHHWAALLFIAAIVVHMFRIFFTGAFRKPRELNWLVGFGMLTLALVAGFSGYSLPDDVLSGNGLRIADGIAKSIPLVGSYASYLIFGGQFPGSVLIPRLFTIHILLIPGLILALVGLHLLLVVLHKHTQYPGAGRTNKNVVGYPFFPVYLAKAGGFFFIVFSVIALMAATMTINPVWNYGPYDPSPVSAGAQPDWYMLFMEGALRLMPGQAEFVLWGFTFSLNILIPAVVIPGLLFTILGAYPFVEAFITGDKREHHVLDRPRNVATRTAIGAALISEFLVLGLAGSNDLIATHIPMSLNLITWILRVAVFVVPVIVFMITKRICLGLQRKDRDLVLHGHETGRMIRSATGANSEVHRRLTEAEQWTITQHDSPAPIELGPTEDSHGVARRISRRERLRAALSRFYFTDRVDSPTPGEVEAAREHESAAGEVTSRDTGELTGPERPEGPDGGPGSEGHGGQDKAEISR